MAQSKTVKRYFNDPQQIVIQTAAKGKGPDANGLQGRGERYALESG